MHARPARVTLIFILTAAAAIGDPVPPFPPVPAGATPVAYTEPVERVVGGQRAMTMAPADVTGDEALQVVVWSGGAGSRSYDPGNTKHLADAIGERGQRALVITVELPDHGVHMFPGLDEGKSLLAVVDAIGSERPLQPKIFVAGFSRGGQYSHRMVWHACPERILGAAPLNAGGHMTLVEGGVFVAGDKRYGPGSPMPESYADDEVWSPRNWASFVQPAKPAAAQVPMLIMCTLDDDERWVPNIAGAEDAMAHGVLVQTAFADPGVHRIVPSHFKRVAAFLDELVRAPAADIPHADAGADQTVARGATVELKTVVRPDERAYWSFVNAPRARGAKWSQIKAAQKGEFPYPFAARIATPDRPVTTFTADAEPGFEYIVQLDVTNAQGRRRSDLLRVMVR